jgi:hypothetical protein
VQPGVTPCITFARFRAKAAAYLKPGENHVALRPPALRSRWQP